MGIYLLLIFITSLIIAIINGRRLFTNKDKKKSIFEKKYRANKIWVKFISNPNIAYYQYFIGRTLVFIISILVCLATAYVWFFVIVE